MSVLRLIPEPPGKIAGRIVFQGRDLLKVSRAEMRDIRGNEISMIFQEPMTALNPVLTIGRQIGETLRLHQGLDSGRSGEARHRDAGAGRHSRAGAARRTSIPTRLSGGMRQRVMIAMALACNPKLLIADEPTTALDVTVQAQILDLMRDLKRRVGAAIMLITHDLGVVAEMAEHVVVMYAGRKVEEAPVRQLFARPRHPYTQGLARRGAEDRLLAHGRRARGSRRSRASCRALKQRIQGLRVRQPLRRGDRRLPARPRPRSRPRRPQHWVACHHAAREAVPA